MPVYFSLIYFLFYVLVAFSPLSSPPSPSSYPTAVSNPQYTPPPFTFGEGRIFQEYQQNMEYKVSIATLIKKNISFVLAYKFKSLVHYHYTRKHAVMQADMMLEK